jgi:hypothetical protein
VNPARIARNRFVLAHAAYLVVTGMWPLVHYRSFEFVTGPKREAWLVRTVGATTTVLGISLAINRRHGSLLSALVTAAFAGAEIRPAVRGQIRPVYLADAALQATVSTLAIAQQEARATTAV